MKFCIRRLKEEEYKLLEDFLYEAIYQPEGAVLVPRSIINRPELQVYIRDFGMKKEDCCYCAVVDNRVIGAVWIRNINGYGSVDQNTPEFAISLYPEYRGHGIGTALMERMLRHMKLAGYQKASLSVQKQNYALRMYLKTGFEIIGETEEEYILVHHLQKGLEMLEQLLNPDHKAAHQFMISMEAQSEQSDQYYEMLPDFIEMLSNQNNYVRVRGFRLICAQAKWDEKQVICDHLPEILAELEDPKPTAVRQCLAALHTLILYRTELAEQIKGKLEQLDLSQYKESMRPLIQKDIEELLAELE